MEDIGEQGMRASLLVVFAKLGPLIEVHASNLKSWIRHCKCVIYQRHISYFIHHWYLQQADNSTDDLEVRVTLLEDDVTDLEEDVEEIRTDNILQDQRFLIIEGNVAENSNDVDGKFTLSLICYEVLK